MQRAQNIHAHVNAGFLFKFDKKNNYEVIDSPNIVYGGISSNFVSYPIEIFFDRTNCHTTIFTDTCYKYRKLH